MDRELRTVSQITSKGHPLPDTRVGSFGKSNKIERARGHPSSFRANTHPLPSWHKSGLGPHAHPIVNHDIFGWPLTSTFLGCTRVVVYSATCTPRTPRSKSMLYASTCIVYHHS